MEIGDIKLMMGLSSLNGQLSAPIMMNNAEVNGKKKPTVSADIERDNAAGLSTEDLHLLSQLLAVPSEDEPKASMVAQNSTESATEPKATPKTLSGDVLRGQLPNIKESHLCRDTDCNAC
jgi:hypothetical protein